MCDELVKEFFGGRIKDFEAKLNLQQYTRRLTA